jgi:hypothetical protein
MFILDPGSNNSTKRGGGDIFCPTSFCSYKYHKIVNNFIFKPVKKFFIAKTLKNYSTGTVLFTPKFFIKLSKIWVWDPGSGKKPIPDPGLKKAPHH